MDEFHRFSDLPEPLRRAIFRAAWRDAPRWPGRFRCSQLRLACRDARAAVDGAIETVSLGFNHKLESAALYACIRVVGSGRFPALRAWRVSLRKRSHAECAIAALARNIPASLVTLELHVPKYLGRVTAADLADALQTPALRQLHFESACIDCGILQVLARGFGPCLELLDLSLDRLRQDGTAMLACTAAARLPALKELNLGRNQIGDAGVRALAQVPWPALEILDLHSNNITHEGTAALASANAERLPALCKLVLRLNYFGDAGVRALVQRGAWPLLQQLDLADNGIGVDGAAALNAGAHCLPCLHTLVLEDDQLGSAGVAALLQQAPWPCLQSLHLSYTGLDAQGIAALAAASQLPALQQLCLNRVPARCQH